MEMSVVVLCFVLFILRSPLAADAKVSKIRTHNEIDLSCNPGKTIKITKVLEAFGSNFSYCDYGNCYWYKSYWYKSRFFSRPRCSIDESEMENLSYLCDGEPNCKLKAKITEDQRCCYYKYVTNYKYCEKRTGYDVYYDCVTGVKTMKLEPEPRTVSISGKQLVIKAPTGWNGKCSCHVYIKDVDGYRYNNGFYHVLCSPQMAGCELDENESGIRYFTLYPNTNSSVFLQKYGDYPDDELNVTCSCLKYRTSSTKLTTTSYSTTTSTTIPASEISATSPTTSTSTTSPTTTSPTTTISTTNPTTTIISSTPATSSVKSTPGSKRNKATPAIDKETGVSTVIIGSAVGGVLLLIMALVITLLILNKRRQRFSDRKNNTASVTYQCGDGDNDSSIIITQKPRTILDDEGYDHLPETRTDSSNLNQDINLYNHIRNGGADSDNYNHVGVIENSTSDDNTYNHVKAGMGYQSHDDNNYNHISERHSDINCADDNYNHIRGNNSTDNCVNNAVSIDCDDYNHISDNKINNANELNKGGNYRTVVKKDEKATAHREDNKSDVDQKPEGATHTHDVRNGADSQQTDDSADIYVNQATTDLPHDNEYANLETSTRQSRVDDHTSGVVDEEKGDDYLCNAGTTEYAIAGEIQNLYENF